MRTTIVRGIVSVMALFLFNGATLVYAQSISVGAKFGVTFSGVGLVRVRGARKPAFGSFITVVPVRHFALQAELLYSPKGGSGFTQVFIDSDGNLVETISTSTFRYVELPILARLLVPLSAANGAGFHASFGPSLALKLGCTNKLRSSVFTPTLLFLGEQNLGESDCSETLKDTDISVVFGAGFDFAVADVGKLTLEARYMRGLRTVSTTPGVDFKNRVLQVLVGFGYRIRR